MRQYTIERKKADSKCALRIINDGVIEIEAYVNAKLVDSVSLNNANMECTKTASVDAFKKLIENKFCKLGEDFDELIRVMSLSNDYFHYWRFCTEKIDFYRELFDRCRGNGLVRCEQNYDDYTDMVEVGMHVFFYIPDENEEKMLNDCFEKGICGKIRAEFGFGNEITAYYMLDRDLREIGNPDLIKKYNCQIKRMEQG